MTNEMREKRWFSLPDFDNETIKIWFDDLLESKNKMFLIELTIEEIKAEIEETKGSIENFKIWGDRKAIANCKEYIKVLKEILERNQKALNEFE